MTFTAKKISKVITHRILKLLNLKYYITKMSAKYTIVMVRHGESEWNQKNLFCGWYDANLSEKGNIISVLKVGVDCIIFFSNLKERKRRKQQARLSKKQD